MRATGTLTTRIPSNRAAALRAWSGTCAIGSIGLASAVFMVVRLIERWRVAPATTAHQFVLLGQTVSYPATNLAAAVVLLLGVAGITILTRALYEGIRESVASIRFAARIAAWRSTTIEGTLVFADERPLAFCAGLIRARVYISTGALEVLDEAALRAVLRHEQHHCRCRDPLRLAAGRVLSRALFFVPSVASLVREQQSLAELAADEWAVAGASSNRSALARALLIFSDEDSPGLSLGIDGARVDQLLLGRSQGWRFPLALCVGTALLLILTVAAAALIGRLATGSASLALPVLSKHPCVVMLATAPAAVWIALRRSARNRT